MGTLGIGASCLEKGLLDKEVMSGIQLKATAPLSEMWVLRREDYQEGQRLNVSCV